MSGVCGHSSPVKPGCYVIFAAEGYSRSYVHQFLEEQGIHYKDISGAFEGVREESYIVHSDDYWRLSPLIWRERAVLWLGDVLPYGLRDAWVRRNNGTSDYLGRFTRVTKDRAYEEESWTYDPNEGAYYICLPTPDAANLPAPWMPAIAYAA